MRSFFTLVLFSAAVTALGLTGCGGDDGAGGEGGGGGSGGGSGGSGNTSQTTTGTHSTVTGSTSSTTTATGQGDCTGTLNGTMCANCVESSCCAELTACLDDTACKACLLDLTSNPDQCAEDNQAFSAIYACIGDCESSCKTISCDAPATAPSGGSCVTPGVFECNPVTNEGCDASLGEACGIDGQGGFFCYPEPNEQMLCAPCGEADGWCAPGMVCHQDGCARYCCDDGDCGGGTCKKGDFSPDVGYCQSAPISIPCDGDPNGVCNPAKESCQCADCTTTAYCVADKCTTDGMCTVDDSCICPDCDASPTCGCNYDGTCKSFTEGCACSDCWGKAECADNPMEKCTDDGTCGATEACVCVDCQPTGLCQDPNYCTDDGECVAYEGCHCNDCANEPTCP